MEENIDIEINETNWGKEQIIIKKKNINLIFIYKKKKKNLKVYRCTEYKTLNKCKSFII